MAQSSSSPVLPRRTSRKVKPKINPDFEYDYVQRRIDQLNRELSASGPSPHILHVPLPPTRVFIPSGQAAESSATSQASVTAQAISTELQLAQLQRDKLALELEVLKLRAAAVETKEADSAESSKPGTTRKKRTVDWPHEVCSGAPTSDFEKLELADFVVGFLKMIKPYEGTRKEVMLQLLESLMLKASSYTWKSVQGFHAHIAKQVELCRLEFDDATQIRNAATIFFKHSDLRNSLPQPRSNTSAGGGSTSADTNSRSSKSDAAQSKTCRQWNYTGSCSCDIWRGRPIQGITNVKFVLKTTLCYIAPSDVLPSPKLTSLCQSHRDSQAPTHLWTV